MADTPELSTLQQENARLREELEALREQCAILTEAEALTDAGSFVWNLADGALHYSPNLLALAGVTPGTLEGRLDAALRFVHPDDRTRASEEIAQMVAQARTWPLEYRMLLPDGRERIWLTCLRFTLDQAGRPARCFGVHRDVTGQREAEAQRELLGALVEASPASITVHDFEGRCLYANPSTLTLHGYPPDAVLGLTELDAPESAALRPERLRRVLEEGEAEFEVVHLRRDGSPIPFQVSARRARWRGQDVLLSIALDVSEHRRVEAALRESEEKFRSLAECSQDYIMRYDRELRHTYMNSAGLRVSGRTAAEMVGLTHREAGFPEDLCVLWEERIRRVFETGEPVRARFDWEAVDGLRSLDWMLSPEFDEHGKVKSVIGVSRDVTEHKRAEDELARREAQLRKIFDILPVGLWFADEAGTLLRGNPAGVRIWGAEPRVPVGEFGVFKARRLPSRQEIAPDDWALARTIREGVTITDELLEIDAFDGQQRIILNSTAPVLDDAGRLQGAVVVNQDITELRQLEGRLHQSQKLETIGRLAGGVAHDFNNLLTVINANAEMALADPLPEFARESVAEIRKAGERAAALTGQLLAFSRRQVVEPRPVLLDRVLLDMDRMLRRLIGEHIELVTLPGEGLRPVLIDPGQLSQVLTNLVVNARDAMPQGGKLTIETRNEVLDAEAARAHPELSPGPFVALAVTDTGVGMDEQVRARLFEPFFTTKPVGSGTGLGLSTCYGIVRQSGGVIQVQSAPGKGTTMTVLLPAHGLDAPEADPPRAATVPHGSESVLLVEDDAGIRRLAERLLGQAGYRVRVAANGSEALAVVEAGERFQLLLTDVVMPLMGGRELADRVRTRQPWVKVLFMSGYTDDSIGSQGVLDPGILLVQKPFSPADLLRRVRETLEPGGGA